MFRKLKLGTQFSLVLLLIFVGGIALSGVTLSRAMQTKAEDEIANSAELLTQTMNGVRKYTSDRVAPLLQDRLNATPTFISEVVPAFSARQVFENFRSRPEYHNFFYKEATLNPTNLKDKADRFEADLVAQFRQQPNLDRLSGYRSLGGERLFFTARPLAIKQASCLQCHSRPAVAPKSQIASFGAVNGFGWKLNDIVAAQTVYVPSAEVFARGNKYLALTMGIFSSIFAIVVLLINRMLKWRVIQPIDRLTAIARQMTAGTMTAEQVGEFDAPSITRVARRADEPGQLARAFQHMAHEVASREQNLTQAVDRRTGLGLVITQQFCQIMGGEIQVTSEAGMGTTFTIRLPVGGAFPLGNRVQPLPPAPAGHNGDRSISPGTAVVGASTILVIDDDPAACDLLQRLLSREGYNAIVAPSGQAGLQLARVHIPDAILLDVRMPELNGWEVLTRLKSDPELADIPVVMVTIDEDRALSCALGAVDYLLKPIESERLLALLEPYRTESSGTSVLVVEDNQENREMIRRQLTKAGCTVLEAEHGRQALAVLQTQQQPGVILLDLMMPEMDGFEFIRQLRQHPQWRALPVIVLTAKDLTAEERQWLDGKTQSIYQKGAGNRQLLDEIHSLLTTHPSCRID